MKHQRGRRTGGGQGRIRKQGTANGHDRAERLHRRRAVKLFLLLLSLLPLLLLLLETTPPPVERGFGRDAPALGEAKEVDARRGPSTVVHEVLEHLDDVVDRRGWVWAREEVAERVEGRVPLERVLVQIWYPLCVTGADKDAREGGFKSSKCLIRCYGCDVLLWCT